MANGPLNQRADLGAQGAYAGDGHGDGGEEESTSPEKKIDLRTRKRATSSRKEGRKGGATFQIGQAKSAGKDGCSGFNSNY